MLMVTGKSGQMMVVLYCFVFRHTEYILIFTVYIQYNGCIGNPNIIVKKTL